MCARPGRSIAVLVRALLFDHRLTHPIGDHATPRAAISARTTSAMRSGRNEDDVRVEAQDVPSERGQRRLAEQVAACAPLLEMLGTVVTDREPDLGVGEIEVVALAARDHRMLDGRRRQPAEMQRYPHRYQEDEGGGLRVAVLFGDGPRPRPPFHWRLRLRVHQRQHGSDPATVVGAEVPVAQHPHLFEIHRAGEGEGVDGRDPLGQSGRPAREVERRARRRRDGRRAH